MVVRIQIPLWRAVFIVAVYGTLFWLLSWNQLAILAVVLLTVFGLLAIFHRSRPDLTVGASALVFGLQGNVMAALIATTVLALSPTGSRIWPMPVHLGLLIDAVATALYAVPLGVVAMFNRGQRSTGVFALLLGISPLFVGLAAFYAMVVLLGYQLKE